MDLLGINKMAVVRQSPKIVEGLDSVVECCGARKQSRDSSEITQSMANRHTEQGVELES